MAGAFDIVLSERKILVDKIINMMKQGDFFHNASEWDRVVCHLKVFFARRV